MPTATNTKSRLERIKDPFLSPPGGWWYRDMHTKQVLRAQSKSELFATVHKHRASNGLPISENLNAVIEHQICRRLPDQYVKNRNQSVSAEVLTAHEVELNTQKALDKWVKGGRMLVDNELAKSRSDICQRCPHNIRAGCLTCKGIDVHIYNWLGKGRRTGYEELLHNCGLMRAYAMLLVHLKESDLPRTAPDEGGQCWRTHERQQARDEDTGYN